MTAFTAPASRFSVHTHRALQPERAGRGRSSRLARIRGLACLILLVACWGIGIVGSFQLGAALVTGLGFLAAIAGLRDRFLGVIGIGILCTMDSITRGFISYSSDILRWNTLNYWLLIVMVLNLPLLLGLNGASVRLLQAFVVLVGAEIAIGNNAEAGMLELLNIVSSLGILVYFVRAQATRQRWYWFSLICSITSAIGGFAYYLHQRDLPEVNANAIAQFPLSGILAVCLGVFLAPFNKETLTKKKQLLLGFFAVVNFCWVFLSTSRGSLLVASLCLAFLLIATRGLMTRLSLAAGGVVLGSLIFLNYSDIQSATVDRLDRAFDTSLSAEERTSGRSDLALGGWYLFLDNPLGVGTGSFSGAWSKLGSRPGLSGYSQGMRKESHSGWIKTLAENGAPGILLLAAFVSSFVVVACRKPNRALLTLGVFVTSCFSLALLSSEFQAKGLWLLLAAAMAAFHQLEVQRRRGRSAPPRPSHQPRALRSASINV